MNHGSKVKRVFWPLVQRPALESVTCWHATSESEYQEIRALGFRQPVAVIPNGIDVPELGEKRPRRTRTLLFLGRIHPKKGLDMLLPAWAAVQDRFPDWRLRIVGDDAGYFEPSGYLAKMRKLALELNLKRVEFTGALYGEAKWRAYHEADLFILPTHSENFGMTVAEALAAGTPAIVTKGAPWSALTTHNCGWWVDIKIDSLTRAMKEAFEEPDETLFEMGRRGRKWMIEEFSWDRISHQLTATYFWLLHKGEVPECVR
jgi:glycosyltransferase involved in cell wall biosynthesis